MLDDRAYYAIIFATTILVVYSIFQIILGGN